MKALTYWPALSTIPRDQPFPTHRIHTLPLQISSVYWVQQFWGLYINNIQKPNSSMLHINKNTKNLLKTEPEGRAPTITGASLERGMGIKRKEWGHIQCTSSSSRWFRSVQICWYWAVAGYLWKTRNCQGWRSSKPIDYA